MRVRMNVRACACARAHVRVNVRACMQCVGTFIVFERVFQCALPNLACEQEWRDVTLVRACVFACPRPCPCQCAYACVRVGVHACVHVRARARVHSKMVTLFVVLSLPHPLPPSPRHSRL